MKQRKKRLFLLALASLIILSIIVSPLLTLAQDVGPNFDYNYLLSDDDMFDSGSMSLEQIQAFLQSKNSPLLNYVDPVTSLSAVTVIYRAAQDWQINPKYLLVLMQKEQSLIENQNASTSDFDWATGYGVCDDCAYDNPLIQKFKGYYNQVYNAAKRIRTNYMADLTTKGYTLSGFGPGITKVVDGIEVTPANNATAIAYTYTPHLHGNKLLWLVWNRYFTKSYPDGSLLKMQGDTSVYLIQNGLRRKYDNESVYVSFHSDFDNVITVNKSELTKYPEGPIIKFANYSFLRVPKGTVYLLDGDTLRGFASKEALRRIGVNPEEIVNVKPEDIADYAEGQPITIKSVYPLGTLLQNSKTGGVYWVQDGDKHPIVSREILNSNFKGRKINKATPKQLDLYDTSYPILFKEGELIKSADSDVVYLISNQQKRPFASMTALAELGYDSKNIITTDEMSLSVHITGEVIDTIY